MTKRLCKRTIGAHIMPQFIVDGESTARSLGPEPYMDRLLLLRWRAWLPSSAMTCVFGSLAAQLASEAARHCRRHCHCRHRQQWCWQVQEPLIWLLLKHACAAASAWTSDNCRGALSSDGRRSR